MRIKTLAASVVLASGASEAMAQALSLEEVIVTTRKTEETVQSIPLSIKAISDAELAAANIETVADLANNTPGLSLDAGTAGINSTPIIRGLTQLNIAGFDPQVSNNVGRFIDGFYQSGRNSPDVEMLDVQRIEVIKGPASALYGRSTFAGAINYITKLPSNEFEGEVQGGLGTDDDRMGSLMLSGPLSDTVGGRIKIGTRTFDGTFENEADKSDNLQGYDQTTVNGSLVWQTTDNWTNTFAGYFTKRKDDLSAQYTTSIADSNCSADRPDTTRVVEGNRYLCGVAKYNDDNIAMSKDATGTENDSWQVYVKSEYELDSVILTGMASYAKGDSDGLLDADFSASGVSHPVYGTVVPTTAALTQAFMAQLGLSLADAQAMAAAQAAKLPSQIGVAGAGTVVANAYNAFAVNNEDVSLEFRAESNNDGPFSWLAGVYYFQSDSDFNARYGVDNRGLAPGQTFFGAAGLQANDVLAGFSSSSNPRYGNLAFMFESDVETYAIFGRVGYSLTDDLNVNLDLRYEEETKTFKNYVNQFSAVPVGQRELEDTWYYATPRLSVDYQVTADAMLYAAVAKGVRSGGFNGSYSPQFPEEATYDSEENWTYEIGAKTMWLDGDLNANIAAFLIDWDDVQMAGLSGDAASIGQVVRNTGSAESIGYDLQLNYLATDWMTLGLGYAYTNARLDDGTIDVSQRARCGVDTCAYAVAPNGQLYPDVGGNQLPKNAKNQFNANVTFLSQIGGWNWTTRVDYNYQDHAYLETANLLKYGERDVVNFRTALENDQWTVALWATNLFDDEYVTAGAYEPRSYTGGSYTFAFSQAEGRRIGVTGAYRF
jgi:iron complex outermembrane receptor protein